MELVIVTDEDVKKLAKYIDDSEKLYDVLTLTLVTKADIRQHQSEVDKSKALLRAWKNEKGPHATFQNLHDKAKEAGDFKFANAVMTHEPKGSFAGCSTAWSRCIVVVSDQ